MIVSVAEKTPVPKGIASNKVKATTATPSLNKLSPSMTVVNSLLAPNSRKRATTETGSVADKLAPTKRAILRGRELK